MENNILYSPVDEIYPGTYVPLLNEEEVRSALKRSHARDWVFPPVNVSEFTDSFRIEFAIPGVKREDFLVHSDGNLLSVCVFHKETGSARRERLQFQEFSFDCFRRYITLPAGADPEFASAEYKEGILRLLFSKTLQPQKKVKTEIAVY